jgi:hypothetical protein
MSDSYISQWSRSLAAGSIGAVALTAVHQAARAISPDAPRMDVVGSRAIEKTIAAAGGTVPPRPTVERMALAGDLLCNSAYYSLIPCGRPAHVWRRAVALGLAAGVGALVLPRRLGLGDPPHSDRPSNQVMTVGWYLLGALATAAAARPLARYT